MINVLNLVSFTLFITVFIYLAFKFNKLKSENHNLKVEMINILQENQVLKNTLENGGVDKSSIEKSDAFLTFLNQSRDWAFEYIENVQKGITVFVDEVEPLLMYFDAYADAGPLGPNYDALKKISVAFKDLRKLLPEETE